LPIATDDHQTVNAREMASAGGARMIAQPDFTPEALAAQVDTIASDPQALANAAGRALSVGRPHATRDLADLVERIANRLSPPEVGPAAVRPAAAGFAVGAPA
jgi:UDP-N-acetylglucosamine--N-acetylmuramyl-(pentapeptide) pyrophosphoryl-undecaprenol N-acetylglucosamine transferase